MTKYTWADYINTDLREQISLAVNLGINMPEFKKLMSSDESESAMLDPDLIIKENFAFHKALGVKIGFAAFFNGEKFIRYTGMVKEKFMFAGNQGIEFPSNILMSFPVNSNQAKKYFKKLAKEIKDRDPGYIGFVQIDTYIDIKGDWWFDDISFGLTPDLLANYLNLLGEEKDIEWKEDQKFKNNYAASLRIFPYNYPHSDLKRLRDDYSTFEGIWEVHLNELDGVFMVHSTGETIKDTWKRLYRKCSGIERFGYLYRIDGFEACKHNFHEIKQAGLI